MAPSSSYQKAGSPALGFGRVQPDQHGEIIIMNGDARLKTSFPWFGAKGLVGEAMIVHS